MELQVISDQRVHVGMRPEAVEQLAQPLHLLVGNQLGGWSVILPDGSEWPVR
jgi:hypothetical protein